MHIAGMSDRKKVAELEAQVSALKAALQKEHAAKAVVERTARSAEEARKAAEDALQDAISAKHAAETAKRVAEDDVRRLQAFIAVLQENLDIQKLMLWAKRSEQLTDADLKKLRKELAKTVMNPDKEIDNDIAEASRPEEESEAEAPPIIALARNKKKRGRQPNVRTSGRDMTCFDLLESHEVVQDLKQEVADHSYAESLVFVREDIHQQLDFVRGHFRNRIKKTYIYRDRDNKLVSYKQELAPDFVKGGKMTNGAAAAVIVDKVIWSLPLYRQAKRINLIGGGKLVNVQLLSSYFLRAAHTVTPVWEQLLSYIKSQRAIHGDETRLLVVNDTNTGSTAAERKKNLGFIWAVSYQGKQAPAAYYTYYSSREGKWARELYEDCTGVALQADGYAVYGALAKDVNERCAERIREESGDAEAEAFLQDVNRLLEEGILLVGCIAHARRKIHTCLEGVYKDLPESEGYSTCNTILGLIGLLYAHEQELRPKYSSGEIDEQTFIDTRKQQAIPIIDKLKTYAEERLKVHEQENNLHKALQYLLNQIDLIRNYVESSELTPDNNFQEGLIRTVAIARKNSLFASSHEGALAWTKLLSLLQTAILNEVDPTLYLKYLLDQVTKLIESDMPNKDVDWSSYLPWNINKQALEQAWDR